MFKRIIPFGILISIGFFIIAVLEPQESAVAAAKTATGTIAYAIQNDTTGDEIWLIEPDGSNDRRIYSTGHADPYAVHGLQGLAWRPDAGELVFAANHENDCSWYAADLYAIFADGSGYRRITNAPACMALANYPKGTVVMTVGGTTSFSQVYIQGAPTLKAVPPGGGEVIFDNVADLGDVAQPIVIINGKNRFMTTGLVDVKEREVVYAEIGIVTAGSDALGAYRPTWRWDGSRIGYSMGCAELYGIADQPPAGNTGQPLFNSSQVTPCRMAWGSTAGTANQIVYYSNTGDPGIYRVTEGSSNSGTLLIPDRWSDVNYVFKIQYLPDASGILLSRPDNWGHSGNFYRYDFASDTLTQLTFYTNQYARDFSLSPDGQMIVYELASTNYQCAFGCGSDLWTMRIDGSNQQLLKTGAGSPSWSMNEIQLPKAPLKVYLPLIKR